ncbi:hypothetical protein BLGI_1232 [Brevibacillus laterosporus GI-9]|nr:hypothetical protein BLGI_1232 [Brevibacillus laterosporus GI-9]
MALDFIETQKLGLFFVQEKGSRLVCLYGSKEMTFKYITSIWKTFINFLL